MMFTDIFIITDHNYFVSSIQPLTTTSLLSSYFTVITPEIKYAMTHSKQTIPSSPKGLNKKKLSSYVLLYFSLLVDPPRSKEKKESLPAMLGKRVS